MAGAPMRPGALGGHGGGGGDRAPGGRQLSPLLHNTAFAALGLDWVSVGFPVPPEGATDALTGMRALGLAGLSVTMPFKDEVARLVDEAGAGRGPPGARPTAWCAGGTG